MSYSESELEILIEHRLELAISSLRPPTSVAAWKRKVRSDEIANERAHPGFITAAAEKILQQRSGIRITQCREVRGTHGMTHVFDPAGVDPPPAWWSRDAAKREHDRSSKREHSHV